VKGTGRGTGKLCDFLRMRLLKDDIEKKNQKNQKTKIAIYTNRENVIGANRRHFYQVGPRFSGL
jgi:hypothetical protein